MIENGWVRREVSTFARVLSLGRAIRETRSCDGWFPRPRQGKDFGRGGARHDRHPHEEVHVMVEPFTEITEITPREPETVPLSLSLSLVAVDVEDEGEE
nr:hypothetical protein GCM10020241_65650 [Streptoalloteichus tenebrarius]